VNAIDMKVDRPATTSGYALHDQGNVWKCAEGGQRRVSEPKRQR
jgi:hypothetical protein